MSEMSRETAPGKLKRLTALRVGTPRLPTQRKK